ncbi:MAG: hypothetical protein LBT83_06510 [Tannerella sp.]|jgi:hypothetical protein|nr:hypothetical protein [Tannerella sp.]
MDDNLNVQIDDYRVFCQYGELEYSFDEDTAIVNEISVYAKRSGIGTMLVEEFEKLACNESCRNVIVPASLSSEALSFWKSLGYKPMTVYDKRKMNRIIRSDSYPKWNDSQGVIELQKQLS